MSDALDMSHFLTPRRRGPSPREDRLFREAFAVMLVAEPLVPPGPAALARAVGQRGPGLPGRLSRLRRTLLREAGFRQDDYDRGWRWGPGAALLEARPEGRAVEPCTACEEFEPERKALLSAGDYPTDSGPARLCGRHRERLHDGRPPYSTVLGGPES